MPTLQKASFLKRISAYLLDFILVVILATGFASVVSSAVNYDYYANEYASHSQRHEQEIKEQFPGVNLDITEGTDEFNALSPADQQKLKDANKALHEAMMKDPKVLAAFEMITSLSFVIIGVGALLSILVVYFVVPLFFKNGQTVGKKIFGLAVIRSNFVKASNKVLFIRAIFGLFAIETMFPIAIVLMIYFGILGIVGTVTLVLFFILQIGVMIYTKTNSCIHDLLSDTVVVDYVSQRIFETEEERIAYIEEIKAEEAAKAVY